MAHSHPHHAHHGLHAGADQRRLGVSLALIAGLMVAELVAGALAHSLALLSDAAHMLTDVAALALSIAAFRLAARPPRGAMTFGLGRAEILSAQANGVTLVVLAALIVYSAVGRLLSPPHVQAWVLVWVALAGVVVTGLATANLARANRESMNVEGSFQHMLTDMFAFAGTFVAGLVIVLTGFERADPIASLLVALIMLRSGFALIRASARVFLEAAPESLSPQEIGEALVGQPGVVEVHDLHVWEVTSGFAALSAHALVARDTDCHAVRRAMEHVLHDRFGIEHTTLQVDHEGEDLIDLEVTSAAAGDGRKVSRPAPATPAPVRRGRPA